MFEPFFLAHTAGISRSNRGSYPTDRPLGYSELETLVEAALACLGPFRFGWGESFSAIGI